MLPKKLAFVDVETTGLSPVRDRIIEIGIVRVENGEVVRSMNQLVNPEVPYSPYIQSLTGITYDLLEEAPTFFDIRDDIEDILKDTLFVAHNARFDYGFLRNEFKRANRTFTTKQLCTARLSRKLYPRFKKHSLSAIIDRYGFTCTNRHRAYDDAHVLWQFYNHIGKSIPHSHISASLQTIQKKPSFPSRLDPSLVDNLPETSGVYSFYDENKTLLYIGKSTNIRSRILSHFSSDYLSAKQMKMAKQIADIQYEVTAGELGALIRESYWIKQRAPVYNRQLRRTKKIIVARKTTIESGYDSVVLEPTSQIESESINTIMGIHPSRMRAKKFLSYLQEKYSLCSKLLGLETGNGPCFAYHLGKCKGACLEKEPSIKYNLRFLLAFAENRIKPWYFDTPVKIREVNKAAGIAETFTLDKWCLVTHETTDDSQSVLTFDTAFDRDIYKILVRRMNKRGLA